MECWQISGQTKYGVICPSGSIFDGIGFYFAALIVIIAMIILAWMWLYPIYNVWRSRKEGEADLAQANFEQRIQVAQAEGRLHAAANNKEAAIIEAEAVAAQIKEIGEGLQRHDLYLRWQWIKMMEDRKGVTIYVPTEANLPILEATRRDSITEK